MARKSKNLNLKDSLVESNNKKCKIDKYNLNSTRNSKNMDIQNTLKIYCNSLETEPNYFNEFKELINKSGITEIYIDVIKTQKKGGKDPYSAVKYAIENMDNCKEAWVVFDKDDFDIEKAIKLAEENNINVAWSNEAFELWLLLHFNFIETPMKRDICLNKLKDILKKKYKIDYTKNSKKIYTILEKNVKIAIANAKKQHQLVKKDNKLPNRANPCTTVYILVEKLNKLINIL